MEQKCAVCGKTMKLVPAGISKRTGKPYEAFYSCPDRCQQPRGVNTRGKDELTGRIEKIEKRLDLLEGLDPTTKKINDELETIKSDDIPF